jgi:hypothetical protein
MKTPCLLLLTMSWAALTHEIACAALLRAEPALECGSGAAAVDWGASSAAGKAVAVLPHSKARTFGPRPLPRGVRLLVRCISDHRTPEIGEGVARPAFSPAGAGQVRGHSTPRLVAGPLPRGEGVGRPAFSPAGAGQVRGHSAPASPKLNRPKQVLNSRKGSLAGNAMNLHQPDSNKSSGAAKSGFIRNETVNNALGVRAPSVVRPTAPSFNNVRHRGPNPAVVGGSLNSHGTNTGTIDGTRMNHRM